MTRIHSAADETGAGGVAVEHPASASAPALVLGDVTVRFGGIHALTGVSADVGEHEVAAIVGPNGAGKTTLLNAICGLSRAQTRGRIELFGESVIGKAANVIARSGVGRSLQDPALLEKETVQENLLVGAHGSLGYGTLSQILRPRRTRRIERDAIGAAAEVMELTGLTAYASATVDTLPYGKRKLVDIARALVGRPRILLLDEPTSGLDAGEQAVVRDVLERLRSEHRLTLLLIEHHMDLVRQVATSVIGLQAGTVLAIGTPSEVLDSAAFRAALVGAATSADELDSRDDPNDAGQAS